MEDTRSQSIPRSVVGVLALLSFFFIYSAYPAHAVDEDFDFDDPEFYEAVDSSTTASVEELGLFGGNIWDIEVDADRDMLYVTAKDAPNGIYRSADGGESWEGLDGSDYGGGVAVEVDQTTGTVYALFDDSVQQSTDGGETFELMERLSGTAMVYGHGMLVIAGPDESTPLLVKPDEEERFEIGEIDEDILVYDLQASPEAGVFYAVGFDDDGQTHLYRTSDPLDVWTELEIPEITNSSGASRIGINPTNADHLILTGGYSDTSYQSTDGGETWESIDPQSEAVSFDVNGRAYIGGNYSDDYETWEALGFDENDNETALGGHALTVDPTDTNVIYADGMPGISKSTDGGQTWTDINTGITGVTITDISQATDKNIVWAAAYNGVAKTENFTEGEPVWEFPILPDPATAIWVEPTDAQIVVVGELRAMKRSTDGGETWSDDLTTGLMEDHMAVNQIIQDVDDPATLYAAVGNGEPSMPKEGMVLVSHDYGETWEDMEILDDVSTQAIGQASDGTLFVGAGAIGGTGTADGVYMYQEGEWTFLEESPEEEIVQLYVDPNTDAIYTVASIAYGNDDSGNFGFYKSEDAGATWTRVTENLEDLREFNSLAIQRSTTPTTLYMGGVDEFGRGVLYKSSNAGDTWHLLYTGLKDETFYTLIFDGVTVGSTKGMFEIKSKAQLTAKLKKKKQARVGKNAVIQITLKDATTRKAIKRARVQILRKKQGEFRKVRTVQLNRKGKALVEMPLKKKGMKTYKVRWIPKGERAEEYTRAVSRAKQLTVRKALAE